jgi:hypothetical protein
VRGSFHLRRQSSVAAAQRSRGHQRRFPGFFRPLHNSDNGTSFTPILPFSFVRRAADYSRSFNAAFTLSPGEKIFGCGESSTSLDKRALKLVNDPLPGKVTWKIRLNSKS